MYLPLEIWYYIIDLMPLEDQLHNIRGVCKDWREKVLNKKKIDLSSALKKRINVKLLTLFDNDKIIELTIKNIPYSIPQEIMSKILLRYRKVEKLSLINIDSYWSTFINIARNKSLKELDITDSNNILNYPIYSIVFNCKNIEKLILKNHPRLTKEMINWFIICFKNLKMIDVRGCKKVKDLDLKSEKLKIIY